jgi:plastocyanin
MASTGTIRAAAPAAFTWRRLLVVAATIEVALLLGSAIILRDAEPAALAVGGLVGLGLLRLRRGTLGVVALALLFFDVAIWTVLETASNLGQHRDLLSLAIPAALAATGLAGLIAAGAVASGRAARTTPWARNVGGAAIALVVLVLILGLVIGQSAGSAAQPGSLALRTKDAKFSQTELSAPAGEITVSLSNGDLFWHTFTIDALGVNVPIPTGGERSVTFRAPPGTYTYYCAIPGHAALAGMRGTLTVR